ncbi:FAD-dependent oxidoreductase, partial [Candidatus Palauibacter sp.]
MSEAMARDYDAIIIGAGVIGVCTGFELAKRGFRTLNVDKLPAAGYGSTSNTCAIIRLHYSTPDGVAMARESYFYWLDWGKYVGVPDPSGLARYVNTGCLVTKTEKNHYLQRVKESLDELHVAYEDLDAEGMTEKLSVLDTRQFGPPVTEEDPGFGRPSGGNVA